jgi:hypothetical protein
MVIIMDQTLKYVIELSKNPDIEKNILESINYLWEHTNPDSMRQTIDGIRYVKLEL